MRPLLTHLENISKKEEIVDVIIDLRERLDHAVLRVEPLYRVDEHRIVHLRFARKEKAGADRLRLRLAIWQDFQRIRRVRICCKKKTNVNKRTLTRETRCMRVFACVIGTIAIAMNRRKTPVSIMI